MNPEAIKKILKALMRGKMSEAYIYHSNGAEILKKFCKNIPLVSAAGCVVTNRQGEVLFIYRNNRWDLPKGKLEKKETLEDCALREVSEEAGVVGLTIENFLRATYHIFERDGKYTMVELKKVLSWAVTVGWLVQWTFLILCASLAT